MTEPQKLHQLKMQLFSDDPALVFAILDGASVPCLPEKLAFFKPQHACLYSGELQPDMAEVAPYLSILQKESAFTEWVFSEGWGGHWGIFGTTEADLSILTKHFRSFLMVYDEMCTARYFRYYDPRVMRSFLPTCDADQRNTIFGPVLSYFVEDEDPRKARKYTLVQSGLQDERLEVD